MKRTILIALVAGLALLAVGALTVSATVDTTPIPYFHVSCSAPNPQLCNPPHYIPVTTGGELQVKYDVPGHCSSIRVHFLVDGTVVHTSGWLGWPGAPSPFDVLPLTTGLVNVGPVSPGAHVLGIQAEGQVGGCNGGNLWSWAGSGTLVTSSHVPVSIDIKPGSFPNCFNSDGHGVIPVAIMGSADFDASSVDPFSVSLDGAAVRVKGRSGNAGSLEDVNEDGFLDLVVQIMDSDAYSTGDTEATLTGNLKAEFDGWPIEGSDSICIRPPE